MKLTRWVAGAVEVGRMGACVVLTAAELVSVRAVLLSVGAVETVAAGLTVLPVLGADEVTMLLSVTGSASVVTGWLADLPYSVIRVRPAFDHDLSHCLHQTPMLCREWSPSSMQLVHKIDDWSEHVELNLSFCRVANSHRTASRVSGKIRYLGLWG